MAEKARKLERIKLGEHLASNYVNLFQVGNVLSYQTEPEDSRYKNGQ